MAELQTDQAAAPAAEKRFFSEHLMLELGHHLVEKGLLSRAQCDELNSRRALTGENFDRLLIKEGLVPEAELLRALADLTNIPFRHIADLKINPAAVKRIQARAALRYKIMPVELKSGVLTLAASQVPDVATADSVRMLADAALEWVLCTELDVTKTIKHFYGLGAEAITDLIPQGDRAESDTAGRDIAAPDSADEGVVKFVNQIISEAIRMGATDIHIEPFETSLRLRYRIDGLLQEIPIPQGVAQLRRAIASCIKIMAEMNIAERRKPHDGRINVNLGSEEFDLRVSVLPTSHGETVNMRILNRKTMFITLENLGLTKAQTPLITYLSSLPHGVILLTGPTGSGKTTTLYAILATINTTDVKIITVEDPIEYQIHGINQIQVHPQIGLTFAACLRHILRHDPDIILIGEIRDMETADIAVRSSLTGHLVFSTLHTNDAPSAITRLVDMGVEPFLVSSCLEGVIAQRLVRRICAACREEMQPDDTILEEVAGIYPDRIKGARFFKGNGCPDCNFTGYKGRIALFETMILNDPLRSMIVRQRPSNELKQRAMKDGMVTLRQEGWGRALDGQTSVEEVLRVAGKADFAALPQS